MKESVKRPENIEAYPDLLKCLNHGSIDTPVLENAFSHAVSNGDIDMMVFLEETFPTLIPNMIKAGISAMNNAIIHYHWDAIINIFSNASKCDAEPILKRFDYHVFTQAIRYNQYELVEYLLQMFPEHRDRMLSANHFSAFKRAAEAGNPDLTFLLLSHLNPFNQKRMIQAEDFEIIKQALKTIEHAESEEEKQIRTEAFLQLLNVDTERLLTQPFCFRYIESQPNLSRSFSLNALVDERVARLLDFNSRGRRYPFDGNQGELFYEMMLNLLKRVENLDENSDALILTISVLLSYEEISRHLNIEINLTGQARALSFALDIAQDTGRDEVLELFLAFPLAQRCLREESPDLTIAAPSNPELGLTDDATFNESAMRVPSEEEDEALKQLKAHYATHLSDAGGIETVIKDFRRELSKRYEERPARFLLTSSEGDAIPFTLPLSFDDLESLKDSEGLTESQYTDALKAYYQHVEHTVWRFLTSPNPWVAPDAQYKNSCRDHLELIALSYLAAKDEWGQSRASIDNDGPFQSFLQNMALIARAHNWDESFPILAEGPMQLDEAGAPIPVYLQDSLGRIKRYEKDDLKPDAPSCSPGIPRRMIQSLLSLSHPKLTLLTKEMVQEELRDYVRTYYASKLTSDDIQKIQKAFETLKQEEHELMTEEESDALYEARKDAEYLLAQYNFSDEDKKSFLSQMEDKYGIQFAGSEQLNKLIHDRFKQSDILGADLLSFESDCKLLSLLEDKKAVHPIHANGFFSDASAEPQAMRESPLPQGPSTISDGPSPMQ